MTEVELERMVVRLIGDASSYKKMVEESVAGTNRLSATTVAQGQIIASTLMMLAQKAKQLAHEIIGAWGEEEAAGMKLHAALVANGRDVDSLEKDYLSFASAMQQVTTTGDETTIQMLQMAETFGLTGEAAKRAAKNAMALAANQGGSAQNYMRMAVMLEQGQTTLLTRVLPGIAGIKDPTEKAAKAQELLGKMFAVTQAEAGTYVGTVQQMKNAIGDLHEKIGKHIADALKPLYRWIKSIAEVLQELPPGILVAGASIIGLTAAVAAFGAAWTMLAPIIAGAKAALLGLLAIAMNPMVLTVGVLVAAVAMLAYGVYSLMHAVRQADPVMNKHLQMLKDSKTANEKLSEAYRQQTQSLLSRSRGNYSFAQDEAKRADADAKALQSKLAAQERLVTRYTSMTAGGPVATIFRAEAGTTTYSASIRSLERAQTAVTGLKDRLEAAKERAKMLREILDNLSPPKSLVQQTEELAWNLIAQRETLGMSPAEMEIYKLQQAGASRETLEIARGQARQLEQRKKQLDDERSLEAMITSARKTSETYWMTPDQLADYEAAALGADAATRRWMSGIREEVAAWDLQKRIDQVTQGFKDQIATLGMSTAQRQLYELRKAGASEEMIKEAETYATMYESMTKVNDVTEDLADSTNRLAYAMNKVSQAGSADTMQTLSDYFYGRGNAPSKSALKLAAELGRVEWAARSNFEGATVDKTTGRLDTLIGIAKQQLDKTPELEASDL